MADQLFNHDLFTVQGIKQATSSSISQFLHDALFDEINNMIVRHTSVEDPDNPGGYIPSKNFLISLAQAIANDNMPADVPARDMNTQDLIDGLKFLPGSLALVRDQQDWSTSPARTTEVLNELASRGRESAAQAEFIKGIFREKRSKDTNFMNDISAPIVSAPTVANNGLGQAIRKNPTARKRLTSEARAAVRANIRTVTDGQRVSREYHEYRYNVIESEQWQGMLDVVNNFADNGLLTSTQAGDYTFGNYVDAVKSRKLVELLRKVDRRARRANVQLTLIDNGISATQFKNNLISQLDEAVFNDASNELATILGVDIPGA